MLSLIDWWRARQDEKRSAVALYETCRVHARQEAFYQAGVSDDVQGRFELLALYLWLVMRHLRRLGELSLLRRLAGVFVSEMDAVMRESGVGDMAVPRRIKVMAQAFYGRLKAYDDALAQGSLDAALRRNIGASASPEAIAALTAYFLASDRLIARASASQLRAATELFAKYLPSL